MQNSLLKLFEHKCVLDVCVHIHPIMIKSGAREDKMSPIERLRCFVVGCNDEYISCHLLQHLSR